MTHRNLAAENAAAAGGPIVGRTIRHTGSGRVTQGLCLAALAAMLALQPAAAAADAAQAPTPGPAPSVPGLSVASGAKAVALASPRRAGFGRERPSTEATHVANWIVDSGDNQGLPFMLVDKGNARVLVFDAGGQLQNAAPVLLGLARGDDSSPGIGERKLSSIRPEERTTPAGRFVASMDRNLHGQDMLWVDYETAISMHRVITTKPGERRAQRLESATPDDNRISYGCINVPVRFFDKVIRPTFSGTNGIVYVLPETRSAREVFGSYDVPEPALQAASPTDSSTAVRK